jgi:quercetin dioxygenase-like cupin family protein
MIHTDLFGKTLITDDEVPWITVEDGIRRKVMAYTDKLMLVKVDFKKGRIGTLHHHPHLQISYVASGSFEITVSGEAKILRGGDVYFIPENAVHGAVCLEDGLLIDVFSPMRENFITANS